MVIRTRKLWVIEVLYIYIYILEDIIVRGGDTDTNGSIVGGLIGAAEGYKKLPENLVRIIKEIDPNKVGIARPWWLIPKKVNIGKLVEELMEIAPRELELEGGVEDLFQSEIREPFRSSVLRSKGLIVVMGEKQQMCSSLANILQSKNWSVVLRAPPLVTYMSPEHFLDIKRSIIQQIHMHAITHIEAILLASKYSGISSFKYHKHHLQNIFGTDYIKSLVVAITHQIHLGSNQALPYGCPGTQVKLYVYIYIYRYK